MGLQNKKLKYGIIIGVVLIVSLVIGLSYAYIQITKTQSTSNLVKTKCFDVSFSEGASIDLESTYPLTDSEGMSLTPYTFTITNTCDMESSYNVNMETLNTSTLATAHLKVGVNSKTPAMLSSFTSATTTLSSATQSNTITSGTLTKGQSVTYNIRLWMDENTSVADGSNKTYASKVVVVASAKYEGDYADASGANQPELYQGLVPVKYDASGNTIQIQRRNGITMMLISGLMQYLLIVQIQQLKINILILI